MFKAVNLFEIGLHFAINPCNFLPGFTTDGEFNSLRTKGQNRPVSIIEIIKEARKCVKSISAGRIAEYFTVDEPGKSWKH